jgi:hypothetical protein
MSGIQFMAIPEFAGIATEVSQEFSNAYAGQQTVEEALAKAQASPTKQWKPLATAKRPPGTDRGAASARLPSPSFCQFIDLGSTGPCA